MTKAADSNTTADTLQPTDAFVPRHIGPSDGEIEQMLAVLGLDSLDALVDQTVPGAIRLREPLRLDPPRGERETLDELHRIAERNEVRRSLIGMGYHDCITPPVIQRNILENPGWYTQYTPYQAEISQGRLEALLNFQTMVGDLTGLPTANASLLDEATAAAEAMAMCHRITRGKRNVFFVADDCHPQTIAVVRTRAEPLGIEVCVAPVGELAQKDSRGRQPDSRGRLSSTVAQEDSRGRLSSMPLSSMFGVLLQYPNTYGAIHDYSELCAEAHSAGALVVAVTDLLALTLIKPPGEWGADIAVGNSQRFGVPLGFGGPHAAFMATHERHVRQMPGRIIGVSKDAHGRPAYRMAVQTREQHIRREKATSNICTAQVLLAIMAGMYAVYHGPEGLRRIAQRVYRLTAVLSAGLRRLGYELGECPFFDTLAVRIPAETMEEVLDGVTSSGLNLRCIDERTVGIALDETTTPDMVDCLLEAFAYPVLFGTGETVASRGLEAEPLSREVTATIPAPFARSGAYLSHSVFNSYRSEHEMLRYLKRLESRDLSLTTSMIPLGSCTMKLNATAEMLPVSWPQFARMHPFAPAEQTRGYAELFTQLEAWLAEITGLQAVSLQPNSGASGEYTGLLVIRAYHASRGEAHRNVCLIPVSAHGTNPASAIMAGMQVMPVACDEHGNINVADLEAKAEEHRDRLAAIMITYPSTHGVFEEGIREICEVVHASGGQVYMDGANMNAQVGLCRPAECGADVVHLNLHKTFCIPHGGGGPGMGPIAVAEHLAPFLPGDPICRERGTGNGERAIGPVAAAPYGSPSILPISWMYIRMMGAAGLKRATQVAILNANYMATRLADHYPILYTGRNGRVAHEFILDCRAFEKTAGVRVEDVAKRLMDYGFHAPTMSWPVAGTLMVEPTESESRAELDRLCDALIAIRAEIHAIEAGELHRDDNPLKHAPHTAEDATRDAWNHAYSREQAAYPAAWLREHKYWPPVGRIDNVYGDRHLFCTCPPVEEFIQGGTGVCRTRK